VSAKRHFAVWCCLLRLATAAPQPPSPSAAPVEPLPLVLEWSLPDEPCYQGQQLPLVLRLGIDARFRREQLVPLFQQPLDLPVLVETGLWEQIEGVDLRWLEPATGWRVATGDRARRWTPVPPVSPVSSAAGDGREWLELRGTLRLLESGSIELPAMPLRYAYATRFTQHFLRGREPQDRVEGRTTAAGRVLQVQPLPAAGRPAADSGYVGEFTLTASVAPAEARVGEPVVLTVVIRGEGDLSVAKPVPWPELPGFVVQGSTERYADGERTWVFELLCLRAGMVAVPPVPLYFFSPRRGVYTTVHSEPVPLQVSAAAGELPERIRNLVAADREALQRESAWPAWLWAVVVGGVLGGVLWLRGALRQQQQRRARHAAAARWLAALAEGARDGAVQAYEAWLVVVAGAGDTERRVQTIAERLPAALSQSWRAVAAAMAAVRYGGPLPAREQVQQLLDRLG
jgi:hypothetical protein